MSKNLIFMGNRTEYYKFYVFEKLRLKPEKMDFSKYGRKYGKYGKYVIYMQSGLPEKGPKSKIINDKTLHAETHAETLHAE